MDWRPPFRTLLDDFKAAAERFGGQPDGRSGYPDELDHPEREAAFFHEIIKLPEGAHHQPSDLRWLTQLPEPWQKQIGWSYESGEQEHVFACGRADAFVAFQDLSTRAAECLPPAVVVPEPLHRFTVPPTHLEQFLIDRWTRFVYQQLGRHPGFLVRRHDGWMELSRNFFAASALAIEMSILPVADPDELAAATDAAIPPSERRTLPFWTRALRQLAGRDYFADRERRFALSNVGDLIRCAVAAGALAQPELASVARADWRQLHDADAAERLLQLLNVPIPTPFRAPDVARRLADALDATHARPGGTSRSGRRGMSGRLPAGDEPDDDALRPRLTPYEQTVCAWVLRLPSRWVRIDWHSLTHADEQAMDRLVKAGLVEARLPVTMTVAGVSERLTAVWRVSGDYGRILGERTKHYLASQGHVGIETGIVCGEFEAVRLTSEGELAQRDFHGRVDKPLFDCVAGGPNGSRGLKATGTAQLEIEPIPPVLTVMGRAPADEPLARPAGEVAGERKADDAEDAATAAYRKALQVVYDTGRQMEALPSKYAGKDEEAIRDHLLSVLASHFQSATGETFNKTGKTDVLVRHNGVPVCSPSANFGVGRSCCSRPWIRCSATVLGGTSGRRSCCSCGRRK